MRSYRLWRALDALTLGPRRRRRHLDDQLTSLQSPLHSPGGPRDWTPMPGPGRAARPSRAGGQSRSERTRSVVAVVGALGALAVGIPLAQRALLGPQQESAEASADATPTQDPRPAGWPAQVSDERATRLLPLPTAPAGSGGYELIGISADATPTRFDPCRPLHYVVNPDRAPRGGVGLVRQAVARASAATGLRFTYDGRTDEPWTKTRRPVQRQRYGDRWVPVLIGWATDREDPELAGFVAGVGGGYSVSREGGTEHFVTGQVVLDLDAFRRLTRERDRATARGIVQHELGHVVGLDHVDDSSQLMYRETRDGVTDYADGDLRGLAIAGDGPCLPDD